MTDANESCACAETTEACPACAELMRTTSDLYVKLNRDETKRMANRLVRGPAKIEGFPPHWCGQDCPVCRIVFGVLADQSDAKECNRKWWQRWL